MRVTVLCFVSESIFQDVFDGSHRWLILLICVRNLAFFDGRRISRIQLVTTKRLDAEQAITLFGVSIIENLRLIRAGKLLLVS